MSARSYLSIGDVLTLLRQEFPDITISKIRFLESQGLVNPERTPSGYRKFYEHDVERLRWVLRQQREHFLPLKVIKDRLDDGSAATVPTSGPRGPRHGPRPRSTTAPTTPCRPTTPTTPCSTDDARVGDPVLVGQRVGAESEARATAVGSHPAGESPLSIVGDGSGLPGLGSPGDHGPDGPTADQPAAGPPPATSRASSRPTAAAPHRRGADRCTAAGAGGRRRRPPRCTGDGGGTGAPAGRRGPGPRHLDGHGGIGPAGHRIGGPTGQTGCRGPHRAGGDGRTGPKSGAKGAQVPAAPAGPKPPGPAPAAATVPPAALSGTPGVSLSAEELASAAGLDLRVVRELQEYGLLVAGTVAGVEHFDEEALAVATVAAGFTRFGIEPRHLRLYKNAAEREAGFVEQVVLPLVRQRNPEARARAHETADELTQLGQQLRASLLRSALGNLLNG